MMQMGLCLLLHYNVLAREATVQKIEAIIREQFSLEMKNKEHEIEVIGQVSTTLSRPSIYTIGAVLLRFCQNC